MSLIRTPGFYKKLSDFYYELGALIGAGIPILNALNHVFKSSHNLQIRRYCSVLTKNLQSNKTLAESFAQLEDIPEFDRGLIEASEKSGRLESCFKFLSTIYQERANLINQFLAGIAYPVFLAHFAVFIFPFAEFFATGNLLVYLSKTLGILIPIYVVTFLVIAAIQSEKNEKWKELMQGLVKFIPYFRSGTQSMYLSRFALSLEALLNAGVPIITALQLSAKACGSVRIKKAVEQWIPRLSAGVSTPSEEISRCSEFPEIFSSQFATGEVSGKLDETLKRLHAYYLEEGSRNLRSGFKMLGHLIFLIIALIIAFKIIMFYVKLYSQYEF